MSWKDQTKRRTNGICTGNRCSSVRDKARKNTLMTLNHGTILVFLVDWVCTLCVNRYNGYAHGIFPASSRLSITMEMMYYWLREMCGSTRSFRSVYGSTRKWQFTASNGRRYQMGRISKISGHHKCNRRTANEAMRRLIQLMDIDRKDVAEELFSCEKWEKDMGPLDFKQLGRYPDVHRGRKRLHSVVIDGKVIALLKDGGSIDDRHNVLRGVTVLDSKIVPNRMMQNAIILLLKGVRNYITRHRNLRGKGKQGNPDETESDGYAVVDNYIYVRILDMRK